MLSITAPYVKYKCPQKINVKLIFKKYHIKINPKHTQKI